MMSLRDRKRDALRFLIARSMEDMFSDDDDDEIDGF